MNHRDVYVGLALRHEALLDAQNELCSRFGLLPRAELHVTLGFLGEASDRSLLLLSRELAPLAQMGLRSVPITGVGGVYKGEKELCSITDETKLEDIASSPRVLWWTLEVDALAAHREALEKALSAVGISDQFLVRPFTPHITIGSSRGSGTVLANEQHAASKAMIAFSDARLPRPPHYPGSPNHKPWDVYSLEKKKTLSLTSPIEALVEKLHITKTELHPQSLYVIKEPETPRGVVVWLTGWPASGKSTIARIVRKKLLQLGRESALLDSDEVRNHIFPALGYSDEERATFYEHLSNMAAFLARQGLIVLVPATANKREFREEARGKCHAFIEVYTMASREESSARDPKGLYQEKKIDFVYEPPLNPEVQIHGTTDTQAIESLMKLIQDKIQ